MSKVPFRFSAFSHWGKCLLLLSVLPFLSVRADLMDDAYAAQSAREEALLNRFGGRTEDGGKVAEANAVLLKSLTDPQAKALLGEPSDFSLLALGKQEGRFQHVLALEMIQAQKRGDIDKARAWRALIQLPKHASTVEGALALQKMASLPEVTVMLTKEYLSWQTTRVREKLDQLKRALTAGDLDPQVASVRMAEIRELAHFPPSLLLLAGLTEHSPAETIDANSPEFSAIFSTWREDLEGRLPSLLTADEVGRRERLLVKLLLLVPKEYRAGVRDGKVAVPLEYREAKTFLVQAQQLINELVPSWRKTKTAAVGTHLGALRESLDLAEQAVARKADLGDVEKPVAAARKICTDRLNISLIRNGKNAVEETALDVRTALSASLAAARAGRWSEAESQRLDAYTSFDTAIEIRVLPRAPELAIKAERSFLDGNREMRGIKAALDARLTDHGLEKSYQTTLGYLDQCVALLKVSVSPTNIMLTTVSIVMREGLEAVVILAALLAGMRGIQNARQRRHIFYGVLLAILFTAVTFWLSRTLIQSLTHFGEKLEAVISVLAVGILLIVTNWVFHKVYWVQWNAKLRQMRNQVAEKSRRAIWEKFGLIGVGFLTIYREGFETSLFMQSLLLEGGPKPVALGAMVGLGFVAIVGLGIFGIGKKLPYRKLLIITGMLVVSVLVTFLGSTVRLFQTVGWISIHPITWLDLPTWMGTWLGLFPSWEGILIPPLGIAYVGGAWLWTKWQARRVEAEKGVKLPGEKVRPSSRQIAGMSSRS